MKIDLQQIQELLAVVTAADISELTIESGDEKITVKKAATVLPTTIELPLAQMSQPNINTPLAMQTPVMAAPIQPTMSFEPAPKEAPAKEETKLIAIASPMVGTFYRAPSPTAPSFVDIGDNVSIGQTVCIIEAMKLMNDLPSEISGKIVKVCVENGTTVEYGQALFMVDPSK